MKHRLEEILKNISDPITGQPLDTHVVACHLSETNDVHLTFFVGDIPADKRVAFGSGV